VTLTRQQHEANQVAERINERRNFCGQAAAGFTDRLIASQRAAKGYEAADQMAPHDKAGLFGKAKPGAGMPAMPNRCS